MSVMPLKRRGILVSAVSVLCAATGRFAMAGMETETPAAVQGPAVREKEASAVAPAAETPPAGQATNASTAPPATETPSVAQRTEATQAAEASPATRQAEAAPPPKLPAPKGRVILSISGRINVTNAEGAARFDREMLENLGVTGFTTKTPWYDTLVTFEGVRLDRLMSVVEATGDNLRATALDEYTTAIPTADFARYHPILALKRDGNYLPLRDKGPLFIVYPYDSELELQHQRFYSRSAWQVVKMVVM